MAPLQLSNNLMYYTVRREDSNNYFFEVTFSSFIDATIAFEKFAKDFPNQAISVIEVRGTTILTRYVGERHD